MRSFWRIYETTTLTGSPIITCFDPDCHSVTVHLRIPLDSIEFGCRFKSKYCFVELQIAFKRYIFSCILSTIMSRFQLLQSGNPILNHSTEKPKQSFFSILHLNLPELRSWLRLVFLISKWNFKPKQIQPTPKIRKVISTREVLQQEPAHGHVPWECLPWTQYVSSAKAARTNTIFFSTLLSLSIPILPCSRKNRKWGSRVSCNSRGG